MNLSKCKRSEETEICQFSLTQSILRALNRKGVSRKDWPEIVSHALSQSDLETMLLDIMDFTKAKEVRLKISKVNQQILKATARRRGCTVQSLINWALAYSLRVPSEDPGIPFEEVTLDRETYERLERIAIERHVTIRLLVNSALEQSKEGRTALGFVHNIIANMRRLKLE